MLIIFEEKQLSSIVLMANDDKGLVMILNHDQSRTVGDEKCHK